MALQGPFFGKREPDHVPPRAPGSPSPLGAKSTLGTAGVAQPFTTAAQASGLSPTAQPTAATGGAKLTVGPNIKLKGVEITDCDTLVVEGTVEATMKSRVIEIAESGKFKGSVEVDIAEVYGEFDGDLAVRERLVIFATGKVTGKTRYGKIVIEEGGQIAGEVTAGADKGDAGATRPAVAAKAATTV